MEITSIGGNITTSAAATSNSAISQEDFIKLFLAQLNYQDPMEPLNNREFLAQLAQFSSLEQSRLSNESLTNLLAMNSSDQALSLIGKSADVDSDTGVRFRGTIEAVHYSSQGATLTLKSDTNEFLSDVSLSQIRIVQ
ncbi:MAG: flagellar basal-body rod modification protein FlgD [Phenylobacterium sp.]|jgi:flagellar basal-body rod modification protein FlgD